VENSVDLVYKDKFGNEQTPKQKFREMCHKFHGKLPSHKKQAKEA
jgi:hypothetical protein